MSSSSSSSSSTNNTRNGFAEQDLPMLQQMEEKSTKRVEEIALECLPPQVGFIDNTDTAAPTRDRFIEGVKKNAIRPLITDIGLLQAKFGKANKIIRELEDKISRLQEQLGNFRTDPGHRSLQYELADADQRIHELTQDLAQSETQSAELRRLVKESPDRNAFEQLRNEIVELKRRLTLTQHERNEAEIQLHYTHTEAELDLVKKKNDDLIEEEGHGIKKALWTGFFGALFFSLGVAGLLVGIFAHVFMPYLIFVSSALLVLSAILFVIAVVIVLKSRHDMLWQVESRKI